MKNGSYLLSDKWLQERLKKHFGEAGGIYELYCMKPKTDILPIDYARNYDPKGTLYIGKAESFQKDVIELQRAMEPSNDSSLHECSKGYWGKPEIWKDHPYRNLYVELTESKKVDNSFVDKLHSFMEEFEDLPPLNRER
ncbi:MAG: hypothetical protein AAFU74_18210 [Bacteroidota bacterium]